MKIAQVTPLYEAVPPKLYGGTERVVAHLTDEATGHTESRRGDGDIRCAAAPATANHRLGVGGEVHGSGQADHHIVDEVADRHEHADEDMARRGRWTLAELPLRRRL